MHDHDASPGSEVKLADEHDAPNSSKFNSKEYIKRHYIKCILLLFIFALIIFLIIDALTHRYLSRFFNDIFLVWVRKNPVLGIFVFILLYVVITIAFVPAAILTVGAGFIFCSAFGFNTGLGIAIFSVFIGAYAGATLAFLLGRYAFRMAIEDLAKSFKVIAALDKAMYIKGLQLNILLRLSPLVPFTYLNYVLAITCVATIHYLIALFAILPAIVGYVYIGSLPSLAVGKSSEEMTNMKKTDKIIRITILVAGAVASLAAVILITIYARRILNKAIADLETTRSQDDISISLQKDKDTDMIPKELCL